MRSLLIILFVFLTTITFAQQAPANRITPDYTHLKYDTGDNNWLNVYQAKRDKKTPVVIWAHANGGTAAGVQQPLLEMLKKEGISLISWESIPQIETIEHITEAEKDLYKVFNWVKANADKYNFDLKNIYIAGASRGTVVSFEGIQKLSGEIKGAYLVEALPVKSWLARDFTQMVTPSSPKIVFAYINPFGTTNAHSPDKAQLVVDKYKSLGIGNRIALYQGVGKEHLFDHLVPFILNGKL